VTAPATSPLRRWRSFSVFTRRLCVFALINVVLVDLVLMAVFLTPFSLTATGHAWQFITRQHGEDSWGPMRAAYDYVEQERGDGDTTVYDEIFFGQQRKFQYPPSALLPLYALAPLARETGTAPVDWLSAISWVSVLVCLLFAGLLYRLAADETGQPPPASSQAERVVRAVALSLLAVTFYPLVKAYTVGQIQAWLNAGFAVALWLWARNRPAPAGVAIGLLCLIKPQYAVFALWGVLRRRGAFVVALCVTVALGLGIAVAVVGFADHLDYLDVLSFIAERGESYYPNQSVNGTLHRLWLNGYNLGWKGREFPPYHPWIYWITTLTSVALLAIGLFGRSSERQRGGALDFALIGLTLTLASPVAWEHHYGILLPILAFMLPWMLRRPVLGRSSLVWLAIAFALCSRFLAVTTATAAVPGLNILQSYLFAGALLIWVALIRLRRFVGRP